MEGRGFLGFVIAAHAMLTAALAWVIVGSAPEIDGSGKLTGSLLFACYWLTLFLSARAWGRRRDTRGF